MLKNGSIAGIRRWTAVFSFALLGVGPATAATAEEGAVLAAREWVKAVLANDVDAQMDLLPKKLYPSPPARERAKNMRLHEKEMALVNKEKYLSFDTQPPSSTGTVGKVTMVVIPYKAIFFSKDVKYERNSSLLAFREEGSSDWGVMDGSGQNPRSLRTVIPGYLGAPRIPPATSKILSE